MDSLDSEMDDSGCIQDESTMSKHRDYAVNLDQYSLLDLPDNVLICILKYCEPRDLKALGFICPRLGSLVIHKSLWVELREVSQPTSTERLMWYLKHVLHEDTKVISITGYADIDGCQGQCITKTEGSNSSKDDLNEQGPNSSKDSNADAVRNGSDNQPSNSNAGARRPNVEVRQLPRITSTWEESDIKHSDTCPGPRASLSMAILRRLKSQCPELHTMEIDYCYIDCSKIDITNFPPTLRRLSMRGTKCYNNRIDHPFMFRISDALPQLEELDVSYCSWFEGSSFLTLSKLPRLRVMVAKDCRRLGEFIAYASVAARFGFKALQVIDMRGSPLATSEVSAFGLLPSLRELYLSAEKRGKQRKMSGSKEEMYDWEMLIPPHYQNIQDDYDSETGEKKQKDEDCDVEAADGCSNKRAATSTEESGPSKRPRADANAEASSSSSIDNIYIDNMSQLIHQRNLSRQRLRERNRAEMLEAISSNSSSSQVADAVPANSSSNNNENREMSDQIAANSSKSGKTAEETDQLSAGSCNNDKTLQEPIEIVTTSSNNDKEREFSNQLSASSSKSDNNQEGSALAATNSSKNDKTTQENNQVPATSSKSDTSSQKSDQLLPTSSNTDNSSKESDNSVSNASVLNQEPSSSNSSAKSCDLNNKENSVNSVKDSNEQERLGRKRNADGECRNNAKDAEPSRMQAEVQPEVQVEVLAEVQAEVQPEVQADVQADVQPEVQAEVQVEVQAEVQPEVQPAVQPELQPAVQPEVQPAVQPEVQPAVQPEVQPAVQPEVQPAVQPEVQPNVAVQVQNGENDQLNENEIDLSDAIRVVRVQGNAGYQNGQNFIMGNRLESHQIVYVNIGERLNGMMQVSFRNNRAVFQRIIEPDDEFYNTYNTQYGRLINPSTLITDDAIRNFGRSDNDVNYIHIGQNGIFVRRHENNSKSGKSKLKILVCTGYIGLTNSSLVHLSTSAPELKFIDFRGTKVNDKGVEKFKSTRLECEVLFGENELDVDYMKISKGLIDELDG